jgi:hypothetical protein
MVEAKADVVSIVIDGFTDPLVTGAPSADITGGAAIAVRVRALVRPPTAGLKTVSSAWIVSVPPVTVPLKSSAAPPDEPRYLIPVRLTEVVPVLTTQFARVATVPKSNWVSVTARVTVGFSLPKIRLLVVVRVAGAGGATIGIVNALLSTRGSGSNADRFATIES